MAADRSGGQFGRDIAQPSSGRGGGGRVRGAAAFGRRNRGGTVLGSRRCTGGVVLLGSARFEPEEEEREGGR